MFSKKTYGKEDSILSVPIYNNTVLLEIDSLKNRIENAEIEKIEKDAVNIVENINTAIEELNSNHRSDALEAIEKAIDKIDVLLKKFPQGSLIPIEIEVEIIDIAPTKIKDIKYINKQVATALDKKKFHTARLYLQSLSSEIIVKSLNLPLNVYLNALEEAEQLITEGYNNDAVSFLTSTLNTLVINHKVIPLPLINLELIIKAAAKESPGNKSLSVKLINDALYELLRWKELGYSYKEGDYTNIYKSLLECENLVKKNGNAKPIFEKITTVLFGIKDFHLKNVESATLLEYDVSN